MKSIIKLLGLSIGCSCTALNANPASADALTNKDSIILTTVVSDDAPDAYGPLSSLQDIGRLYAL